MSDVVPELFILPGFRVKSFSRRLIQICMVTGHPATQHTSHRQPRPNLAARADRAYRQPTNMQLGTFCYR